MCLCSAWFSLVSVRMWKDCDTPHPSRFVRNCSLICLSTIRNVCSWQIHSFIHSFILHSVNPYKFLDYLKDIELVILLIIYI